MDKTNGCMKLARIVVLYILRELYVSMRASEGTIIEQRSHFLTVLSLRDDSATTTHLAGRLVSTEVSS